MFGWFKKEKQKKQKSKKPEIKQDLMATIDDLKKEVERLKVLLVEKTGDEKESTRRESLIIKNGQEKIVEGIFNGFAMVGNDGKQYDVPANYASKSKLVEGDSLKLTVTNTGSFIFKQTQPVERERHIGILEQDARDLQYWVRKDERRWKLITASVTYFKGQAGDEVIFLIPQEKESQWAAVENILNK